MIASLSHAVRRLFEPAEEAIFISRYEAVRKLHEDFEKLPTHNSVTEADQHIFEPVLKAQRNILESMCDTIALSFDFRTKPSLQRSNKLSVVAEEFAAFQGAETKIHTRSNETSLLAAIGLLQPRTEDPEELDESEWFRYLVTQIEIKIRRRSFVMPVIHLDRKRMPESDEESRIYRWPKAVLEPSRLTITFRNMIQKKALRKATAALRRELTVKEFEKIRPSVTANELVSALKLSSLRFRIQLATELVTRFRSIKPEMKTLFVLEVLDSERELMKSLLSALPIRTCDFFLVRPRHSNEL